MTNIIKIIEINAPSERVFDFVKDFEKMNTVHEGFTKGTCTNSEKPFGVGTTAHFVSSPGGSKMEWDMMVTEYEPNVKIRFQSSKPNLANILTLEPTVNGTRLTHQTLYELPYSVFGKLMDSVKVRKDVNREIAQELEGIKKAVEESKL